jgi:hypothetical protein
VGQNLRDRESAAFADGANPGLDKGRGALEAAEAAGEGGRFGQVVARMQGLPYSSRGAGPRQFKGRKGHKDCVTPR